MWHCRRINTTVEKSDLTRSLVLGRLLRYGYFFMSVIFKERSSHVSLCDTRVSSSFSLDCCLNPWGRFRVKLVVMQLGKKFSACYGTRKSRARHFILDLLHPSILQQVHQFVSSFSSFRGCCMPRPSYHHWFYNNTRVGQNVSLYGV
jgi:hypothetical protein